MLSTASNLAVAPVPTGLMTAAVDFINAVRPAPSSVEFDVTALALRLRFDTTTARALAARVRAAASMFADDRWASVRRLRASVSADDALMFELVVIEFIAAAPLDDAHTFDVDLLLRKLLAVLPSHGRC